MLLGSPITSDKLSIPFCTTCNDFFFEIKGVGCGAFYLLRDN